MTAWKKYDLRTLLCFCYAHVQIHSNNQKKKNMFSICLLLARVLPHEHELLYFYFFGNKTGLIQFYFSEKPVMRENMEEINKTAWPNANASFNYDFLQNIIYNSLQ